MDLKNINLQTSPDQVYATGTQLEKSIIAHLVNSYPVSLPAGLYYLNKGYFSSHTVLSWSSTYQHTRYLAHWGHDGYVVVT